VLASTNPTAATVLLNSETGGAAGGSVCWRRGCVLTMDKAAHTAANMAIPGRMMRFMTPP
jgi:hypothetical protein